MTILTYFKECYTIISRDKKKGTWVKTTHDLKREKSG